MMKDFYHMLNALFYVILLNAFDPWNRKIAYMFLLKGTTITGVSGWGEWVLGGMGQEGNRIR